MNDTLIIGLAGLEPKAAKQEVSSRVMTISDIPELVNLWFESYPPEITDDSTSDECIDDWSAAFAGEYGKLITEASRVVECDGKIVAAVQTVEDAVWDDTPSGPFLIEVIVHPSYRRKGLAKTLLADVHGNLAALGFHHAALRVDRENTSAQSLYRALGYRDWQQD